MPTITVRTCPCGTKFTPHIRDVRRGNGKYCSRLCCNKYRPNMPVNPDNFAELLCDYCKEPFTRRKIDLSKSKSGLLFCSRVCKDLAQRIDSGFTAIHPPHYGSTSENPEYRKIAFRHHPAKCNRCGYDRYKSILRVHHKDRNRANRNPENLEILCPTCHDEEHFRAGDGLYSRWDRDKLVELVGSAPTASALQVRRSPK